MSFLNKYLHVLVGFMMLSLGLWLVTSLVDRYDHSTLVRAGLLILGLGGIAWGLRRDEGRLVAIGLLLLTVSVFCLQMDGLGGLPGSVAKLGRQSNLGYRLWHAVSLPLEWRLRVPVGYLILGVWVVVNAMMFVERVPPRTIVGANLVFLASVVLMRLLSASAADSCRWVGAGPSTRSKDQSYQLR